MNTIPPITHTSAAMTDNAQQIKIKETAKRVGVDYPQWVLFIEHCNLVSLYCDVLRKPLGNLTDDEIRELRKGFNTWVAEKSSS